MEQPEFKKMVKLLEKYNLSFCRFALVKNSNDAVEAAQKLGFPIVLKIISSHILHKSDIGGVIVNIVNKEQVIAGFNNIMKKVKKKMPEAKIEGIVVQKQHSGQEIIIGMKRDAQFGPVIMFGLGGIFVEILKDVVFRIAPVDLKEADKMIKEIKSYALLKGIRGKKPVNTNAIAGIITMVSKMVMENKKITELDLNPVIVDDKKARIADVRIMYES